MIYSIKSNQRNNVINFISVILLLTLSLSCSVSQVHDGPGVSKKLRWVMLPVINLSLTPQAGIRTEAILETHLRSIGIINLEIYPYQITKSGLPDLNERHRYEVAFKTVRKLNYDYAITGTIDEWRYKSGLDGEPAVGVSLKIIDMKTGKIVWSVSGSRTGWGYESVSGTVNKLLEKLLSNLNFK